MPRVPNFDSLVVYAGLTPAANLDAVVGAENESTTETALQRALANFLVAFPKGIVKDMFASFNIVTSQYDGAVVGSSTAAVALAPSGQEAFPSDIGSAVMPYASGLIVGPANIAGDIATAVNNALIAFRALFISPDVPVVWRVVVTADLTGNYEACVVGAANIDNLLTPA